MTDRDTEHDTTTDADGGTTESATTDGGTSRAATIGERLTGERDPRDPDGLLTVDQIAGGSHGASPEEGLRVPRDGRIEEPTADRED
jgi:hypothetical protein